jgi:hypothetical protein
MGRRQAAVSQGPGYADRSVAPGPGATSAVVIRCTEHPLPFGVHRWLRRRGTVHYDAAAAPPPAEGALVVVHAAPFRLPEALEALRRLRRNAFTGAVVVLLRPEGLRTTTLRELFRCGADEVVTSGAPTREVASRAELAVQFASLYPQRPTTVGARLWEQPRDTTGALRPLEQPEVAHVLRTRLGRTGTPDFAFAVLRLEGAPEALVWERLHTRVRIHEGDLVARLGADRYGIVFEAMPPGRGGEVVARVLGVHPRLGAAEVSVFYCPQDRQPLLQWLLREAAPAAGEAS